MNTEFDYTKTYYKVTNENEIHHGYQYKDGLNILIGKFNNNPNKSCVTGGFYFTDYKNLINFLDYGVWIREVTIPTDAKVVKDPDGNKWRADKIIFGNKYHIKNDFDKWFDPEKFDWNNSEFLAKYFTDQFDIWFDPEKFNWNCSEYLAKFCSDHFDKWFDPEKFDWDYSNYLAEFCSNQFDKWFDPEKYNWNYSKNLAEYCSNHFDKWFDPEKFNWFFSNYLAKFCSDHFDKWFDPEKFDWTYFNYLIKYCSEHKDKWEKYLLNDF